MLSRRSFLGALVAIPFLPEALIRTEPTLLWREFQPCVDAAMWRGSWATWVNGQMLVCPVLITDADIAQWPNIKALA